MTTDIRVREYIVDLENESFTIYGYVEEICHRYRIRVSSTINSLLVKDNGPLSRVLYKLLPVTLLLEAIRKRRW